MMTDINNTPNTFLAYYIAKKGVFVMDYEILTNGNVKIGDIAPEFEAIQTIHFCMF